MRAPASVDQSDSAVAIKAQVARRVCSCAYKGSMGVGLAIAAVSRCSNLHFLFSFSLPLPWWSPLSRGKLWSHTTFSFNKIKTLEADQSSSLCTFSSIFAHVCLHFDLYVKSWLFETLLANQLWPWKRKKQCIRDWGPPNCVEDFSFSTTLLHEGFSRGDFKK